MQALGLPLVTKALTEECKAKYQDLRGTDVEATTYSGSNDVEKDESCCQKCKNNVECEFWVRSTVSNKCWLKKQMVEHVSSKQRRGGFKIKDHSKMPTPTPAVPTP